MTREQLNTICAAIRAARAKAARLDAVRAQIEALRDAAKLQTTKAIYQAVLDLFEEEG